MASFHIIQWSSMPSLGQSWSTRLSEKAMCPMGARIARHRRARRPERIRKPEVSTQQATGPAPRLLKYNFHGDNDEARLRGVIDAPPAQASELSIRDVGRSQTIEERVVQRVVEIGADLPAKALADSDFFVGRELDHVQRLASDVGKARGKGAQRKRRLRLRGENRGVEPHI